MRRFFASFPLLAAAAASGQQATFTVLTAAPIGENCSASAVSADGSVVIGFVGGYQEPGYQVWRWTPGSQSRTDLGWPAGATDIWPVGISADGLVIYGWASFPSGAEPLYRWTSADGWEPVPQGPQGAMRVSANGSVIGGSTTVGGVTRPYRWTQATGMQIVGPLGGGPGGTYMADMSRDGGTIVGADSTFNPPNEESFVWTVAAGILHIPLLPGCFAGEARALNGDGTLVMGGCYPDGNLYTELPWVWTAAAGVRPFVLTRPEGPFGTPSSMTPEGTRIVGSYGQYGPTWIWSPTEGDQRLDAVLARYGVGYGLALSGGGTISADGRTIIGGVAMSAFIATIPAFCYANCDGSTVAPILNINDFTCFLNRYAAEDAYANCDGSTTPPILNVLDFTCFLNRFAAGCP